MNISAKIIITVLIVTLPPSAFAYIDPGTGSILIQGLIAAVAAIGVTLKLYWHRLTGLFKRREFTEEEKLSDTDKHSQ